MRYQGAPTQPSEMGINHRLAPNKDGMLILFTYINYFDKLWSRKQKQEKNSHTLSDYFYKPYKMDIFSFHSYNHDFYCNPETMRRHKEHNYSCSYRCKH